MPNRIGFSSFTFFPDTRELFNGEDPVSLPPKASLILGALLASPGRVVSREELYRCAWGETIVEFEHALNTCIRQIRVALRDEVGSPEFIQTVPRIGYRWCHPITDSVGAQRGARKKTGLRLFSRVLVGIALAALLVLLLEVRGAVEKNESPSTVVVAGFQVLGDPGVRMVNGIDVSLEAAVRSNVQRLDRTLSSDEDGPEFVLTGALVGSSDGILLTTTLLRTSDGSTVWTGTYDPFCERITGDPVSLIGSLVAHTVVSRVAADI